MKLSEITPLTLLLSGRLAYDTPSIRVYQKFKDQIHYGPQGIIVRLHGIYYLNYESLNIEEVDYEVSLNDGGLVSKKIAFPSKAILEDKKTENVRTLELILSPELYLRKELDHRGGYVQIENPILLNPDFNGQENTELLNFKYPKEKSKKETRKIQLHLNPIQTAT